MADEVVADVELGDALPVVSKKVHKDYFFTYTDGNSQKNTLLSKTFP